MNIKIRLLFGKVPILPLPRGCGRWLSAFPAILLLNLSVVALSWQPIPAFASSGNELDEDHWIQILQSFDDVAPIGELTPEHVRLRTAILNAPLEDLPPPLRTGLTERQIRIHAVSGNMDGIRELEARILNNETWPRHDLDAIPLKFLSSLYMNAVVPQPGGLRQGMDESAALASAEAYWAANIMDRDSQLRLKYVIADETNPAYFHTMASISHLMYLEGRPENLDTILSLAERLHGIELDDIFALGRIDEYGLTRTAYPSRLPHPICSCSEPCEPVGTLRWAGGWGKRRLAQPWAVFQ